MEEMPEHQKILHQKDKIGTETEQGQNYSEMLLQKFLSLDKTGRELAAGTVERRECCEQVVQNSLNLALVEESQDYCELEPDLLMENSDEILDYNGCL